MDQICKIGGKDTMKAFRLVKYIKEDGLRSHT